MSLWSANLDAIYSSDIAVDASLTPGTGGSAVSVRAIDKTVGIEVSDPARFELNQMTIRPAAYVRMSQLGSNSLTRDDLDEGTVTIGAKVWRIKAHMLRPNPDGELNGEVCMFLQDDSV